MKIYLYFALFILHYYFGDCLQPYFPPQIVFSLDSIDTIFAIDELNQQAYTAINYSSTRQEISFVAEHFPFAIPDSPQSKYYVQLELNYAPSFSCVYGTYWKYGVNNFNNFPSHWWVNASRFEIKNYMIFQYDMVFNQSSIDEDHWYSNVTCSTDTEKAVPCQEIYFKKRTQIPLRFTEVIRQGWDLIQVTINYRVISVGPLDKKYFDLIPKNWSTACQDYNLGLLFYPQTAKLNVSQSVDIHITLLAPPHQIHGNDTVGIRWNATSCTDCLTWTPEELYFNGENFQQEHIMTITRVKDGPEIFLSPIFNGGGYDLVPSYNYFIFIQ